jgi:uncharacterized protein YlzI (FlbEa/FlbD family)
MFIRVTEKAKETPIYINVNNIETIEQDGDITIIMTNSKLFYYVKETADDIIQTTSISRMLSVS